jgi:hypothetical protein
MFPEAVVVADRYADLTFSRCRIIFESYHTLNRAGELGNDTIFVVRELLVKKTTEKDPGSQNHKNSSHSLTR